MFNFEFKWWEALLLVFLMIFWNIVAFPCFLLQRMRIKAKRYANWLNKIGADELTIYDIYVFKD
jgi:hypothetical protein